VFALNEFLRQVPGSIFTAEKRKVFEDMLMWEAAPTEEDVCAIKSEVYLLTQQNFECLKLISWYLVQLRVDTTLDAGLCFFVFVWSVCIYSCELERDIVLNY
jgi:hypothetical protein